MSKTKNPFKSYIRWTDEIRAQCSDFIERGFSYKKTALELNKLYPEHQFSMEGVRHQKRAGLLSINPRAPLNTNPQLRKEQQVQPNDVEGDEKFFNPYYKGRKSKKEEGDIEKLEEGHNFEMYGNYAILDYRGVENPSTLNELLEACNVDRKIWDVDRYVVNKWEVAMKLEKKAIVHRPLFQIKAWLCRKIPTVVEFPHVKPIKPIVYKPPKAKGRKKRDRTVLILPDAQVGFSKSFDTGMLDPFHDRRALDLCLQMAEEKKPNEIILLGDMLDLPEWSDKFLVSPEFYWTTQPSINELYWWITELRKHCEHLVYIEGNHEKRMAKAVIKNIIAAYNLKPANEPTKKTLTIPTLLALEEMGVEYCGPYPDGEYWINDNLRVSHGQIARKGGGKSTLAILNDARNSEIVGHIHRHEMVQKTVHPRYGIKTYVAYSPGTLARIDGIVPSYQARNDWQQGFAMVHYQTGNGFFQIVPYSIHDGECMADGNVMTARKKVISRLEKMIK